VAAPFSRSGQWRKSGRAWTRAAAPCLLAGVTPDHRRARLAGFALGTCAAACLGLAPVATKGALAGFSPELVGVTRLGAAALVFRMLGGRETGWMPRDGWSLLAGIALGIDFLCFNYGLRLTTAAVAGLLVNFGQVASVVLARLVLGEPLTARRLIGSALTVAGVVIVSLPDANLDGGGSLAGNLLIMLASVAWSTYAVAQRRSSRTGRDTVFQLMTPIFVIAALVSALALIAPDAWHNPGGAAPTAMLALLIVACTITPYFLYSRGQELLDVVVITIVLSITPVFAVALSWLVLGEAIGWHVLVGGAIILAGIVVVALERR
jgi:drug/metabolite transporter (DMT)-like permease